MFASEYEMDRFANTRQAELLAENENYRFELGKTANLFSQ